MTDGLNQCNFIGNLGDDPDLRVTQGGTSVLNMRIAVNTSYIDRDNNRQERCEWVTAVVWGKRGEGLAKILHKGDRIFVSGEMRTEKYEKDGEDRYYTKIHVVDVVLGGGGRGGNDARDDRRDDRRDNRRDDRKDDRRDTRGRDERDRGRDSERGRDRDRRDGREDDRGQRNVPGMEGRGTARREERGNGVPPPPPVDDYGFGGNADDDIPF